MTKYRAVKTKMDGHVFDSTAEANRYFELTILLKAGAIQNLELQPRFEILPKTVKGTRTHHYTADFRYVENGETVIEDVKGKAARDYSLR